MLGIKPDEHLYQYRIFIKFPCPDRDADDEGFQHMLTTVDEYIACRYIEQVMTYMNPMEFHIDVEPLCFVNCEEKENES